MSPIVIQHLPPSKSFTNRLFVMAYLAGVLPFVKKKFYARWQKAQIPDDINLMLSALESIPQTNLQKANSSETSIIDVGAAGTVLRFVLAVASLTTQGRVSFSATQRLRQRPLQPLIEALSELGANISGSWGNEKVSSTSLVVSPSLHPLRGGDIAPEIGSLSSQFITALLLIAPYLSSPLFVPLPADAPSKPYIAMTLSMMHRAGALFTLNKEGVLIQNKPYNREALMNMGEKIEGDWSAASYIYGWTAILPLETRLFIPHLTKFDTQGDKKVADLMLPLGVQTHYIENGGILLKRVSTSAPLLYQPILKDYPDLFPALFVTVLMQGQSFFFNQIGGVRLKESDRLSALSDVAQSLGFIVEETSSSIMWRGKKNSSEENISVRTLQDHRLPMAWSIALLKGYNLHFDDASVVSKSYPLFWEDATRVGIEI